MADDAYEEEPVVEDIVIENVNKAQPMKKEKKMVKFDEEEAIGEDEGVVRVPLPKEKEMLAIIEKLLGAARVYVRCIDGKQRLGRVPGSKVRKLYIQPGDLVIIKPWEYEEDTKCDVEYKYRKVQINWLRNHGYLKKLEEEF